MKRTPLAPFFPRTGLRLVFSCKGEQQLSASFRLRACGVVQLGRRGGCPGGLFLHNNFDVYFLLDELYLRCIFALFIQHFYHLIPNSRPFFHLISPLPVYSYDQHYKRTPRLLGKLQ